VDKAGDHKVQGFPKYIQMVRDDESLQMTLVSEVLASLKDHGNVVAPLSDPEAPIEERDDLMKLYLESPPMGDT
jgi:hypothetical protein